MDEPSVLDYIKSIVYPRKYPKLHLQELPDSGNTVHNKIQADGEGYLELIQDDEPSKGKEKFLIPWRGLIALVLALLGQAVMGLQPGRDWKIGSVLIIFALALLVWAVLAGELQLPRELEASSQTDPPSVNFVSLVVGGFLALVAFISFGNLEFSILNLGVLAAALWFVIRGFWITRPAESSWLKDAWKYLRTPPWKINLTITVLGSAILLGLVVFFRFFRLGDVPPEMNSDHAEKFLDVLRVLKW